MATPKDLPHDIGEFIRDLRHNARISLRQLAEQAGVSNPYLSQIERGLRKPSAEVLQQLASALRVSTPMMYLRAGLLDLKDGQGVLAAIAADPDLTESQKQSLTQIYETFRRENARGDDAERHRRSRHRAANVRRPRNPRHDAPATTPRRPRPHRRKQCRRSHKVATATEKEQQCRRPTPKIPAPLYAAAGAGDLAIERLRKLPGEGRRAAGARSRPSCPAGSTCSRTR